MPAEAVTAPLPAVPAGMAVVPLDPPNRRVLPALCLGSFVTALAFVAPTPFLAVIAADLGVGVPLLGQVVTAQLLLGAALALLAGPLADHYGHRRLVVLGLVAASASLVGSGLAPAFWVLLLTGLASGLADATVPGLSLAIAGARFAGPASRRALSWTIAALAGAPVIGVPFLTAVGDVAGWRVAFIGAGLGTVGVAALVAAWLPGDAPGTGTPLRWRALRAAYHPLLRHRPVQRLYAASMLRAICWFGLLTYLGAFLDEELGLATRRVGLAYRARLHDRRGCLLPGQPGRRRSAGPAAGPTPARWGQRGDGAAGRSGLLGHARGGWHGRGPGRHLRRGGHRLGRPCRPVG
ncbi:MAG: MFS transporter, partial [Chloroflexota bacterium]|nr:MFS transporter [Chloroflexota bacterium]